MRLWGRLLIFCLLTACGGNGDDDDDNDVVDVDAASSGVDAPAATPDAASADSAADVDGAVDPFAGVACGASTCADTDICCATCTPACTFTCTVDTSCGGDIYECDGPEDCGAGQSCCLDFGGDRSTVCRTGPCPELCHDAGDCTTPGDVCCAAPGSPDSPFTPAVCTAPGECG